MLPLWLLVGVGLACVRVSRVDGARKLAWGVFADVLCHQRYRASLGRDALCAGVVHGICGTHDFLPPLPR